MKNFDPAFTDHLNGEVTTLCNCWQIELADTTIMGFTDHDRDVALNGILHEAASGFESSEIEDSLGISTDEQEIAGALQSNKITAEDIFARKYDGARIKHFVVNWNEPSQHALMRTLIMGDIFQSDTVFKASVKSQTSLLDQTKNRRYQKLCSAQLGDKNCKVLLGNSLKKTGVVRIIISSQILEVSGIDTYSSGWFRSGEFKLLTGSNAGRKVKIAEHIAPLEGANNSILHLWEGLPEGMTIDDTFEIIPGCDKHFSTCKAKFSNGNNFRGFPHMPDAEYVMSYASVSEQMDGGPIFPQDE
ncbi:MAG: DUF2163 domain-containing protein [Rhizobiales bacterium]|nr:DUF2163 domain-containing protein [Hyphomicrobiales bacterium]